MNLVSFACTLIVSSLAPLENSRESTVGVPARITDLVLPAPPLEATRADRTSPIMLRVLRREPHGDAYRYDLEYYGLDPGHYDLTDYLVAQNSVASVELPPIDIEIRSVLPPGQITPHPLRGSDLAVGLRYRDLLIALGIIWVTGLAAVIVTRKKRRQAAREAMREPTLEERLKPLVEKAMAGTIEPNERARLESTLLAFWREKLALSDEDPKKIFSILRAHEDAGPLLRALEDWLHRPVATAPSHKKTIPLRDLLAPYRNDPLTVMTKTARRWQ